ncbi:hypothetical protein [Pseudomonas sp. BN515]|uniref:hypothetical protein n=1 Tax=Pseudomonas sp. BN515 TaxID=2567892 RepID=UPI002455557C|nr:hypothetical protein [Pseudomonas sp. BN515]MDH4870613.1 hypothetical protein [Pseudomonas sp. BN515]
MGKAIRTVYPRQLPRYHVMMNYPNVHGRRWVVLEEDYRALVRQRDLLLEKVETLLRDGVRLDAIQVNGWDVRFTKLPDIEEAAIGVKVVGHYMTQPVERVIGVSSHEDLRAAIDQARAADADPPEIPKSGINGRPVRRNS